MNKKNGASTLFIIGGLCLIATGIGIGAFLMFNGSETRTSATEISHPVDALICKSTNPEGGFFKLPDNTESKHEIKITYEDGQSKKISYSLNNTFDDETAAKNNVASLHADYNIYMGENNLNVNTLSPSFVSSGNVVRLNLFATLVNLKASVSQFFFLTSNELSVVLSGSETSANKIYTSKNFTCTFENN